MTTPIKYPSVTRILDATMAPEKRKSLQAWRDRVGEEEAERIRTYSFERGRKIDADVEMFKNTGTCEDQRIVDHLTGYTFLHHELTVTSEVHKYSGRFDAILGMSGRAILTDFKGSRVYRRPSYLHDYNIQIGAYWGACMEMGIEVHAGCVCVFIEQKEKPLLHWIHEEALQAAHAEFIVRRQLYARMEADGMRKGEAFIADGHTLDSLSLPIDPGALYNFEDPVLWRVGLPKPAIPL